tara:strand:+ start:181 stop:333 length:153 start_codon:yes stop_codon:yes gene_type:complete
VQVFIDWCSIYQQAGSIVRSADEQSRFERAKNKMGVWFAHKLTVVYLVSK